MKSSAFHSITRTLPGARPESVNEPSAPVTAAALIPEVKTFTLTPAMPAPPRTTRPLISVASSIVVSTEGAARRDTLWARTVFGAYPSRRKLKS